MIVEQAIAQPASGPSREWQLLVLSARTSAALEASAERLATALTANPSLELADVAYTLQTWARNPDWENDTTIFAADAAHSPNSARVHFLNGNHALQELKQGKVPVSLQRQQYFLVMKEFRRAIELYPAYAEPHVGIGEAYTFGGDFPAAIDWYRRIVTRNPRYGVGHRLLGNAFFATQQYDSAIVHLKRSIAEDPSQADAYNAYALGLSYQAKGDREGARTYLEKAYALEPSLKK